MTDRLCKCGCGKQLKRDYRGRLRYQYIQVQHEAWHRRGYCWLKPCLECGKLIGEYRGEQATFCSATCGKISSNREIERKAAAQAVRDRRIQLFLCPSLDKGLQAANEVRGRHIAEDKQWR